MNRIFSQLSKNAFITLLFGVIFGIITITQNSGAVPSFARQTGMPCSSCHTVFPQLNSFGRLFKLNGYTMTGPDVNESKQEDSTGSITLLKLLKSFPLSVLLQTSATHVSVAQPGTQNDYVAFPQQLSLFVAGEISPKIGTFIQVTYDQMSGAFAMDNADIRFADNFDIATTNFIYGVTLNNNPSVQDLWHTLPAWGYPFASSAIAPSPITTTLLDGGLTGQSMGLGAYGLWNNWIYGEISAYRSAFQGGTHPFDATATNVIKGLAPYWRFAIQHQFDDHYISVGAFGLTANMIPAGISGATNQLSDIGVDVQYEYTFGRNGLTAFGSIIHENQKLGASQADTLSQNASNDLTTMKLTAGYNFNNSFAVSFGYFSLKGSMDNILYAPKVFSGSNTGKPDSEGLIAEIAVYPWLNTRFSLQYLIYNKFNGSITNYDGSNRNASNNNTLHLMAWIMF